MSRRTLTLAVLTIMTYVVAACASPTAPRNEEPQDCRGGWSGANTRTCP
jgi:hypothetical protein